MKLSALIVVTYAALPTAARGVKRTKEVADIQSVEGKIKAEGKGDAHLHLRATLDKASSVLGGTCYVDGDCPITSWCNGGVPNTQTGTCEACPDYCFVGERCHRCYDSLKLKCGTATWQTCGADEDPTTIQHSIAEAFKIEFDLVLGGTSGYSDEQIEDAIADYLRNNAENPNIEIYSASIVNSKSLSAQDVKAHILKAESHGIVSKDRGSLQTLYKKMFQVYGTCRNRCGSVALPAGNSINALVDRKGEGESGLKMTSLHRALHEAGLTGITFSHASQVEPEDKKSCWGCDCTDETWYDSYERDCDWYEAGSDRCRDYGNGYENFGLTANQACCACVNFNDPYWYDSDGPAYDCGWYSVGNRCATYGNNYHNFQLTANEACCACHDATHDSSWVDSYGDGCDWYAIGDRCSTYGNYFENNGKTANDACCFCGSTTVSYSSEECQCWANGASNEAYCEMDNDFGPEQCEYETNDRCHWGPLELTHCRERLGECGCYAKEEMYVNECMRSSLDVNACGNNPHCYWGPLEKEECNCRCWANAPEHEPFCERSNFGPSQCVANSVKCHWGPTEWSFCTA